MTYFVKDIKRENQWQPFFVAKQGDRMRSVESAQGVGDRLRAVAFAEIQAFYGFLWGWERFPEVSDHWKATWLELSQAEERHAQLLLDRAVKLDVDLGERRVSDALITMFCQADSPELFQYLMVTAESRGMEIGLKMVSSIRAVDPISADIFEQIAEEEREHVERARSFLKNYDYELLQEKAKSL